MNHMKQTPEFWDQVFQVIAAHKEQGISASLATGRGKYNGGGWKKTLFDGGYVRVVCMVCKRSSNATRS